MQDDVSNLRATAFSVAYRMIGLPADAEDVAQEAMLRWHRLGPAQVRSPHAYIARIAINLSVDRLSAKRAVRDLYVADWLPGPISDELLGGGVDADQLEYAVLVLLQTLTPLERAVFILRASFDCDYAEIAEALQRSADACRQIFSRARKALRATRPRPTRETDAREVLLRRLIAAIEAGDVRALTDILAEDVVVRADGGGRGPALKRPLAGAARAAQFLIASRRLLPVSSVSIQRLNGGPALVLSRKGAPSLALLVAGGDRVERIFAIADQAKLTRL